MTDSSVGIPTEPAEFTIIADHRDTPSLWYISSSGNALDRLDTLEPQHNHLDARERAVLIALLEHTLKLVKDLG